jgi:hypothetical protein
MFLDYGWKDVLQLCRVAVNKLNKQLQTYDKVWSFSLGLNIGLTTPHLKNKNVTKDSNEI